MPQEDDNWVQANDDWRHDPERRTAASEVHARWLAAAEDALALISQADAVLRDSRAWQDKQDPLASQLDRAASAVFSAKRTLEHISTEPANDTRIGNMAAFGTPRR